MNSVMGIGENILFLYNGRKEWQGNKDEVMTSSNELLNNFIFASDLFRKVKKRNLKKRGNNKILRYAKPYKNHYA